MARVALRPSITGICRSIRIRVEAGLLAGSLFRPSPIGDDRHGVALGFEQSRR